MAWAQVRYADLDDSVYNDVRLPKSNSVILFIEYGVRLCICQKECQLFLTFHVSVWRELRWRSESRVMVVKTSPR